MENLNNKHIEQKSTNILYPVLNIAAVASLSLLFLVGISNVGGTVSYFSDLQASVGNFFTADPLYFSVDLATSTIEMGDGDQTVVPEMVPGEKSDPIQYLVAAQLLGGDTALCNALSVLGTAPFVYDAPLAGLQTATSSEVGPWALTFSLASGAVIAPGASCSVDLAYTGWNAGVAYGHGYNDVEHVVLSFSYNPPPVPAAASAAVETAPTPDTDTGSVEGTSTEVASPDPATTTPDTSSDSLPANDTPVPPTQTPDPTQPVETPPVQTPPVEVPPTVPPPQPATPPTAQQ